MRVVRVILINAAVLTVLFAVLFAALEWAANWWLWNRTDDQTFRVYASYRQLQDRARVTGDDFERYAVHRYIGYIPKPNYRNGANRHNSLGFRGDEIPMPKPPGEFRIVCIGGSTTYTPWVWDIEKTYPARLEAHLREAGYNVRVINAGGESWTTHASLVNLQLRVIDLDPDLLVIYHAINDIISRAVWPPEAYKGDNSGAKVPVVSNRVMPSIWEQSTMLRILMLRGGLTIPHSSIYRTINPLADTMEGFEDRDLLITRKPELDPERGLRWSFLLKENPPIYFRRNMENMLYVAKHHGVAAMVATFARSTDFPEFPWVSSPEIDWAYVEANGIIKSIAREQNVPCFDFEKTFPTSREYFTDGCHVSEAGADLKAAQFAAFIVEEQLIPAANRIQGGAP